MDVNVFASNEKHDLLFLLFLQILKCAAMWEQLETLHACFNRISNICDSTSVLHSLTLLNLESNPISSWEEILKLSNLPR